MCLYHLNNCLFHRNINSCHDLLSNRGADGERPYAFDSQLLNFTITVAFLVPILIIILAALGLYKKSIFLGKSRLPERGRLILAAVFSVAALIVYDFFTGEDIFPVRIMALTSVVLSFISLLAERIIMRFIIRQIFKKDYATKRGIEVHVINGSEPENLYKVFEGEAPGTVFKKVES